MSHTFRWVLAWIGFAVAMPACADLRILATTADWGALARELGGEHVDVYIATSPRQDVHRVEAKPSLIARTRRADLLVANGAELEAGWLPVLVQESGNARIQPGAPGYFEAAANVRLREVPTRLDRSLGDIHPQGNPHIHLDPRNVALVAKALAARLAERDRGNASYYARRAADFDARWRAAMVRWRKKGAPLEGVPVVVIHRDQAYLASWLGLVEAATIEPKPGVPPSAGYLGQLVAKLSASPPRMILRNAYNDPKAVNWLSKRIGVPVVLLPYSVGGTPEAKDLFALYEDTLDRLLAVRP
jgi:zinc/manganese transport system substrate-binding protein